MDELDRFTFGQAQSLSALVNKSDFLYRDSTGVHTHHRIETPLHEEIPDPHELIRKVIGTVSMRHFWTGEFDVHHVAWPGCDYVEQNKLNNDKVASVYRGMGVLKIRMPRQLHNYIHAITEPPPMPSRDIMEQWTHEYEHLSSLYCTVRMENMHDVDAPEEEKEQWRFNNFKQKLETIDDLSLTMDMDDLRSISDIVVARRALRSIVKPSWYANSKGTQRRFFAGHLAS